MLCAFSGSTAFEPLLRIRMIGQKYADLSPLLQVVPPAARLSLVEKPSVVRLPT